MRGPRSISASPAARGRPGAMRGPLLSTLLLAALWQVRPPGGCGGPHFLRSEIKKEEKMGEVEGCVPCGNTSRRVGSHVLLIKSCFS